MSRRRKRKKSKLSIILCVILILAITYGYYAYGYPDFFGNAARATTPVGETHISFIDVGQGDASLIQTKNYVILIDTGSRSARENILETLNRKEIESIDLIILTHQHEDHIGNTISIIYYFDVLEIKYPKAGYDTNLVNTLIWQNTLEAINDNEIRIIYPEVNNYRYFDDVRMDILGPLDNMRGLNNNSIALRLTHGNKSFLFLGDAEREAEHALIAAGKINEVDVLLVPHHGSNTSSTIEFLDATNPRYAIISVGADNRFGHPHSAVINRLESSGIYIKKTSEHGTITVISTGNNLKFRYQNSY